MSSKSLVGWDVLYKLIEKDLKTEADVIIAITHWFLIVNGKFRCLGVGDQKTLSGDEESSELLPKDWNNAANGSYSLRYIYNDQVYVLLGTITNDTIILNLLSSSSLEVANTALNIKDTVKSLSGPLSVLVPEIDSVVRRFKNELLDPVINVAAQSTRHSQTQTPVTNPSTSNQPPIPFPPYVPDSSLIIPRSTDPLRDIGRGDLDPLGRGGGGMLFNPPGMPFQPPLPGPPGRHPFPGVVPGSRFDPFGPPEPGRRARGDPDNDHFPPPGYDDMFM